MSNEFVITAQLQLQGIGFDKVTADIKQKLSGISVPVNVEVNQNTLQNLKTLNGLINELNSASNLATRSNNLLGTSLDNLGAASSAAGAAARGAGISYTQMSVATKSTIAANNQAATSLEGFVAQIGLATRRFGAFVIGAGAVFRILQGIRTGVSDAIQFEREMLKVTQVSSETNASLNSLRNTITQIATAYGVSSTELAKTSVILKQAGLSARETEQALDAVAKAALAPNFDSMSQTAEGAIAVMNQFKLSAGDLNAALGSMNAVAGEFAVEGRDLIETVKRAGGAFSQTGGSLNELIALFTAVRSSSRESAESIATGLRTIFSRLQRPEVVESLKALQINLRYTKDEAEALGNTSLTNQFVGAYEAIQRVSEALETLRATDPRYAQITEQLGGTRNISRVIPLIREFTEAQRALNVAKAGTASLDISAAQAQGNLSVEIQKTQESFAELFRIMINSSEFQNFAKGALSIANSLAEILKFAKPLLPVLEALALSRLTQTLINVAPVLANSLTRTPRFVINPAEHVFGRAIPKARGGVIPGVGDGDTVPAMLTPGEYVINKNAVKTLGQSTLDRLNNVGQGDLKIKKFADGGPVGGRIPLQIFEPYKEITDQLIEKEILQYVSKLISNPRSLGPGFNGAIQGLRQRQDLRKNDFINEAYQQILEKRDTYDPSKGKLSTFIAEQVKSRIRNLSKVGQKISKTAEGNVEYSNKAKTGYLSDVDAAGNPLGTILSQRTELRPDEQVIQNEELAIAQAKLARVKNKQQLNDVYKELGGTGKSVYNKGTVEAAQQGILNNLSDDTPVAQPTETKSQQSARLRAVLAAKRRASTPTAETPLSGRIPLDVVPPATFAQLGVPPILPGRTPLPLIPPTTINQLGIPPIPLNNYFGVNGPIAPNYKYNASASNSGGFTYQVPGSSFVTGKASILSSGDKQFTRDLEQQYAKFGTPAFGEELDNLKGLSRRLLNSGGGKPPTIPPIALGGAPPPDDSQPIIPLGKRPTQSRKREVLPGPPPIPLSKDTLNYYNEPKDFLRLANGNIDEFTPYKLYGQGGPSTPIGFNRQSTPDIYGVQGGIPSTTGIFPTPFRPKPQLNILEERRNKLITDAYKRAGGPNLLSDQTIDKIQESAEKRAIKVTERELYSANKRILDITLKEATESERKLIAKQETTKAINGEQEIIRKSNGKIAGSAALVEKIGVRNAPGAGGLAYNLAELKDRAFGRDIAVPGAPAGTAFGRFARGRADFFNRNPFAFYGLTSTLPYIGEAIKGVGPDAQTAVEQNRTGFYKGKTVAAGTLSSATVGATVGFSVGGLPGAGIGFAVGAITGFVTSLQKAEEDIRQVKINSALTLLTEKLNALAGSSGINNIEQATVSLLSIQDTKKELSVKSAAESSAFTLFGQNFGYSAKDDIVNERKGIRESFGSQLPLISKVLNRQAEDIGKANVGASVKDLSKSLSEGNNGLNAELIGIIASIRRISFAEVVKELGDTIKVAQKREAIERKKLEALSGEDRNINTFGRLVLATQAAADSISLLKTQAHALNDVFSGIVSSTHVSLSGTNLGERQFNRLINDQFGRREGGVLTPLGAIASITGEQGNRLLQTGNITNEVEKILPSILASVASQNPRDETDFVTKVETLLKSGLKGAPGSQEAIATVITKLNEIGKGGLGDILKEVKIDATKLSQTLIKNLADPVKEAGEKIAKILESQSNEFIDGLVKLRSQISAIGESYDRLAQSQVGEARLKAEFATEGTRYRSIDVLSQSTLEYGFRSRQQRLAATAGVGAAGAESPEILGANLNRLNKEIDDAVRKQQEASLQPGRDGKIFAEAALNLVKLKDQSANLQLALKHLTDVSERSAGAQEKLSALRQDKDARLAFGERYLTGNFEEQSRTNRGLLLLSSAAKTGNLNQFTNEDRKLIVDTGKALGNTQLSGIAGRPIANKLIDELVANSAGGVFQPDKQNKSEEAKLKEDLLKYAADGQKAQIALIDNQQKLSNDFFGKLTTAHENFYTRLAEEIRKIGQVDLQNKFSATGTRKAELEKLSEQKGLLGQFGITKQEQFDSLVRNKGNIESYVTAISRNKQQQEIASKAAANFQPFANLFGKEDDFSKFYLRFGTIGAGLKNKIRTGVNENAGTEVTDVQKENISNYIIDNLKKNILGQYDKDKITRAESDVGSPRAVQSARNALITTYLAGVTKYVGGDLDPTSKKLNENISSAYQGISGIPGLDKKAFTTAVKGGQGADIIAAISALEQSQKLGLSFSGLDTEVNNVNKSFNELAKTLNITLTTLSATSAIGNVGEAIQRAGGGSIFSAKGTDTVPAMLTPGEFVVNKKATEANRGLLEKINSGSVKYFADGGRLINYPPLDVKFMTPEEAEKAEKISEFRKQNPVFGGLPNTFAPKEKSYDYLSNRFAFEAESNPYGAAAAYASRGNLQAFNYISGIQGLRRRQRFGNRDSELRAQYSAMFAQQAGYQPRNVGQQAINFYDSGGHVMGPSGRDVIPAYLSNGEYVLNRSATANIGVSNLNKINGYASGGSVVGSFVNIGATVGGIQTLANGGQVGNGNGISTEVQQAFGQFSSSSSILVSGLDRFFGIAQQLSQSLQGFPGTLTITGNQRIEHIFNGAEVFNNIIPEIKEMVDNSIKEQLTGIFQKNFPEAGINLN